MKLKSTRSSAIQPVATDHPYRPFSERAGLTPVPPQLRLGEVSPAMRNYVDYAISEDVRRSTEYYFGGHLNERWLKIASHAHVLFFNQSHVNFNSEIEIIRRLFHSAVQNFKITKLFDMIEFLLRHDNCSAEFKFDIARAFVRARAAYRVVDDLIVAVGTVEQAAAFEDAVSQAEASGAGAARTHLIASGKALREGDWAGSVRESIHAVEAMAVRLAPGTETLGPALAALERNGHLHGSLKKAFGALYGYSCDEEGVRHALVLNDKANVDEADALLMLGACASFVSYLIARGG